MARTITSDPAMGGFDVLVRGGEGVGPRGVAWADAAILDGLVAEIGPDLAGAAGIEIDAEVVSYDPRRGVAYGQRLPPAVLRERMAIVKKG